MGLCKAIIIGHLGKDPEVRYTPDGLAVASFSVAATEKVKGQDRTEWFRVSAFGKLGEICGQYLLLLRKLPEVSPSILPQFFQ